MREALLNAFTVQQWEQMGWIIGLVIIAGLVLTGIERSKK